jgi:ligand-binding SRPBCC domain-containing protein
VIGVAAERTVMPPCATAPVAGRAGWARARSGAASPCFTGPVRCIRLETVIAAPAGDCFGLSLSVDAHTASMRGSGERAIGGVTSGIMKLGDTVTWRARHFGVVFRMTSAITGYQYPSRFVDEQLAGPFRRWWHEHTFTPRANGETVMADVVQFQSPLGPLGSLADRLVLDRYLPHLLRQRNAWLKTTLEART